MFEPPPFRARPRLVEPVRIDRAGESGPTPGQARGPHWRTTSFGLHVPARVQQTTDQRILEAAAVLRDGEAVTGWAALHWEGGAWFGGTANAGHPRPVALVVSRHVAAQPVYTVSQEFLAPYDISVVDGVPITRRVRSTTYEMRYAAALGEAVEALDMACFSDLVSLAEIVGHLAIVGPVTGIQQARDALLEADENSWSPRETAMRGVWTRRAGLGRPLCNAPVFSHDGRHVGTADLIDPVLGLVGEYNSSLHLTGSQVAQDLKKDSAFRDLGLETITMVTADWGGIDDFVRRLWCARDRALRRTGPPGWTVQPPPWWTPTMTVGQRRALVGWERERFLRYRRAA